MGSSLDIRRWSQRCYLRLRSIEQRAVDAYNRRVDQRISLAVGSILIVVGIGSLTKPLHARVEFYAAVAQILPILMLVAAVDGRYFRERDEAPPLDRFLIRGFWVIGLIGLGAALVVVARGHDSVMLRGLVVYALMLVGALVTVYALHGPARVRSEADGTSETTTANQSTRSPDRWD